MRQLRVELTRFRSRRAILLMLLAGALLTVLFAGTAVWDSRPVTASQLTDARNQAAEAAADPDLRAELATCRTHPQQYFGAQATAAQCDRALTPQMQKYLPRQPLPLAQVRHGRAITLMLLLSALAIIAGATFAGGDWASGSMGNQLLFEPRRTKVWLAKALAVTLGTLAATAVLVAGFWLALTLTASARGLPLSATVQEQIRWLSLRGVLLAGFAGLGGYALTMLLRHTVGAVALLFAYAVGGEALVAVIPGDRVGRWSLGNNVVAWLRDGARVFDDSIVCGPSLNVCDQHYRLALGHGAVYLGTLLVVTLALSWLTFRRRDVP